jgi:hypothetical protein
MLAGLVPLVLALIVKRLTVGPIAITNVGLFYVWIMFTLLAVVIVMLRSGIIEFKKLQYGNRMLLASVSILMNAAIFAIFAWVEIWLVRLIARTH